MSGRTDVLLSFDVGRQKTGIAVGNALTNRARPLAIVRGTLDTQLTQIEDYMSDWNPARLIVGLPVHMDGTAHAMTKFSRLFGKRLEERFNLPIQFVDERLSSVSARAHSKDNIDAVAAAIILQDWLDAHTHP